MIDFSNFSFDHATGDGSSFFYDKTNRNIIWAILYKTKNFNSSKILVLYAADTAYSKTRIYPSVLWGKINMNRCNVYSANSGTLRLGQRHLDPDFSEPLTLHKQYISTSGYETMNYYSDGCIEDTTKIDFSTLFNCTAGPIKKLP
tara:strand:- start:891 stop:1325 length:435 start_codon:yes stop_codon:yes gene_type:complete